MQKPRNMLIMTISFHNKRIKDRSINLTDKPATYSYRLPLLPLTNHGMSIVFEELLRKFNEGNNEEAGKHFTPRDAISLLSHLVFDPVRNDLPKITSINDPAKGSRYTKNVSYLKSMMKHIQSKT